MTSVDDAQKRLQEAQVLLEAMSADVARIEEFLAWFPEATAHMRQLESYYRNDGQEDIDLLHGEDAAAITPPVADEDSVWEVASQYEAQMMRMLRLVTAEMTTYLDEEPEDEESQDLS